MKISVRLFGKYNIYVAAVFLLCAAVFASTADAQTNRRTVRPIVSPTPVPTTQTVPEIVSRASDYPNGTQVIVPETPPENSTTMEDKLDKFNTRLKEMSSRLKSLESTQKNEYDEKQKRLLLNLDILTRAEQRAESLRKQLYELIEKENSVKSQIERVDFNLRPEMVERSANFAGSLRPEEIREQNKKSLETEKEKLNSLILQIKENRVNLEENVRKADSLVEKVRSKTEKEIDDALIDVKSEDN